MNDRILPGLTSAFLASALILTSCGNDDGAAVEGSRGAGGAGHAGPGPEESSGVDDADADDEAASGTGESDELQNEPSPLPASSDGPAENWPEPEKPEEMFVEDQAGAEAAIAYWWETHSYARLTGDPEPMYEISGDDCVFCEEQGQLYSDVYRDGGWYVADYDEVVEAYARLEDGGLATLLFTLDQGKFNAHYPNGDLIGEVSAKGEVPWTAALAYQDEQWVVLELMAFESQEAEGR